MRRKLLIVIPLLLAISIAIGAAVASSGEALPPAKPVALDPAIAAWVSLTVDEPRTYDVNSTNGFQQNWTQVVTGWEALDGEAHAHVEMAWAVFDLHRAEWLRPGRGPKGEAQLVCSLRRLDEDRYHHLEPPQPVLQTPLTVGATWSWTGRIDETPCKATFRVVAVSENELQIEQRTVAGSLSSTYLRTYLRGRGLVRESADLPTNDPGMASELQQTSTLAEPD